MLYPRSVDVRFQAGKSRGRPKKNQMRAVCVDVPIRLAMDDGLKDTVVLPFVVVVKRSHVLIRATEIRSAFGIKPGIEFSLVAERIKGTVVRMGKGGSDRTIYDYHPEPQPPFSISQGGIGQPCFNLGPLDAYENDGSVVYRIQVYTTHNFRS